MFLVILLLGTAQILPSQALAPHPTTWRLALRAESPLRTASTPRMLPSSETHSHTRTGLLVGSLVGVAASGLFLGAFCSDPDTKCGADEVGRAVLIIAVPSAVAGAVIGSLIRTKT